MYSVKYKLSEDLMEQLKHLGIDEDDFLDGFIEFWDKNQPEEFKTKIPNVYEEG